MSGHTRGITPGKILRSSPPQKAWNSVIPRSISVSCSWSVPFLRTKMTAAPMRSEGHPSERHKISQLRYRSTDNWRHTALLMLLTWLSCIAPVVESQVCSTLVAVGTYCTLNGTKCPPNSTCVPPLLPHEPMGACVCNTGLCIENGTCKLTKKTGMRPTQYTKFCSHPAKQDNGNYECTVQGTSSLLSFISSYILDHLGLALNTTLYTCPTPKGSVGTELDFSNISLDSFNKSTLDWSTCPGITKLTLYNSGLTSLSQGAFSGAPGTLKTLALAGNNITKIQNGTFDHVSFVTTIDLSYQNFDTTSGFTPNMQLEVEALRNLSSLEHVNLNMNNLDGQLRPGLFKDLSDVTVLVLTDANINSTPNSTFTGLRSLESRLALLK